MRIALLSRSFHPALGGLERMSWIVARGAAAAGHSVEVVTDTPSAAAPEAPPFRVTRTRRHVDRIAAFRRADVALLMNVCVPGLVAAAGSLTPVVAAHHGFYWAEGLRGATVEPAKRTAARLFENVFVSSFVQRRLGLDGTVIENAYDDTAFRGWTRAARPRDFVFCGRLVSEKGADVAIAALGTLTARFPAASLTIVGDGPERAALERLASSLPDPHRVRFRGALSGEALAGELAGHACLLVPSRCEEAFGIVALEGAASCDLVLASNRGGLPEAVGPCGRVVSPDVESFATAMAEVLEARVAGVVARGTPEEQARREHLARHAPGAVVARYLAVLERAAGATRERE